MSRTHTVMIKLDDEEFSAISAWSVRTGIPMGVLARMALKAQLEDPEIVKLRTGETP